MSDREDTKLIAQNRPTNRPILPPGSEVVKPDQGPAVTYRSRLRPPLAGPYAFSRIPAPVWDHPRVFLMHDVASPWLFTNTTSGYDFLFFVFSSYTFCYTLEMDWQILIPHIIPHINKI